MSAKKTASTSPTPTSTAIEPVARGEVTRAKLIECAHGLFLKKGFHGTSMRQIADEAGIALGGTYNHFASKDDIFAAVLDAYHPYHAIFPALEQTQGETVEDFMRDAARHVRDGMTGAENSLLPLVFTELVEFQGVHLKELGERLFPSIAAFVQRLSERKGRLRVVPVPVMVRTFMSLMIGHLMTEMVLKNSPLLKQMQFNWFDDMVDIYLHGIVADPEA